MIDLPSEFFNRRFFHEIFGKKVMHVENAVATEEKLLKHAKKYRPKCYCICPVNVGYVNENLKNNISKENLSKGLKKVYLELKKYADLQLHVHLSLDMKNMPFSKKKEYIESAYNFFKKELGITPKEIVYGWTTFDEDSLKISENLGLKPIKTKHFHVYDFWLK